MLETIVNENIFNIAKAIVQCEQSLMPRMLSINL